MLQTDPREAVNSIYMIQDSVCAKDRPNRGIYMIYNSVCARDRFIICKEHLHEDLAIDLITNIYLPIDQSLLLYTERLICAKGRPARGCREHIYQ